MFACSIANVVFKISISAELYYLLQPSCTVPLILGRLIYKKCSYDPSLFTNLLVHAHFFLFKSKKAKKSR